MYGVVFGPSRAALPVHVLTHVKYPIIHVTILLPRHLQVFQHREPLDNAQYSIARV